MINEIYKALKYPKQICVYMYMNSISRDEDLSDISISSLLCNIEDQNRVQSRSVTNKSGIPDLVGMIAG